MEKEKFTTIRCRDKNKQRLSDILKHNESFDDGLEFLLYMWQFPKSAMVLRKGRTVMPPFSQEEKDSITQRISK